MPRVALQPLLTLNVGDRQLQRAVPELGQVLHNPSPASEPPRQLLHSGNVDQPKIDLALLAGLREEVAQIKITMMQPRTMKSGSQISRRIQEPVKRHPRCHELVGSVEPSEILR